MRVLVLDNYDSFTYNLVQYLGELGAEPTVVRNDVLAPEDAVAMNPDRVVISPGPGRPEKAGYSEAYVKAFAGRAPLLGVCLGHQAIITAFGGSVDLAPELKHGKTSDVRHDGTGLLTGLHNPFVATRYHSLAAVGLPDDLIPNAWSEDDVVQGIRHRSLPIHGVQFHPESVLTVEGMALLKNFLTDLRPAVAGPWHRW
ncbi:MAG: aminodeoxychorismate/anthranilate synthase component II [Acidimicrobiia bacterium]|nr:aminodeoxychorismate/anthranilate synthase component II [Acidimicrobiia bacterium]